MGADEIKYSKKFPGDRGNYGWSVQFDITGRGYVGITQYNGDEVKDRVLLSPEQFKQLTVFGRRG